MQQLYREDNPIKELKILSPQNELKKENNEVQFLLVLTGEITLEFPETAVYLDKNDVILIHPSEHPVVKAFGNNLLMTLTLKKTFFEKNGIEDTECIICNSAEDKDRDYSQLRRILSGIALAYFDKNKNSAIRVMELCYSLLYYLSGYHFVAQKKNRKENSGLKERWGIITEYLEENFMNQITLAELADLTHINSTYLCRFFKKEAGTTFNEYLKNIRLRHAIDDLNNTDKPVTSISYENGFATPAAFCRIFAAAYGETPSKFRKKKRIKQKEKLQKPESEQVELVEYKYIEDELQSLINSNSDKESSHIQFPLNKRIVVDNIAYSSQNEAIWKKLINLGFGKNLINAEFQKQLAYVQKEIGFKYGRIEGLLNNDILQETENGEYNFTEFDRIISIMQANKILPYIDLSIRGANVLLSGGEKVLYRHYDTKSFSNEFFKKVSAILRHCINRYGLDAVNEWVFDIGIYHNEFLRLMESPKAFSKRAKTTMEIIRSYLPDALIGAVTYNAGMRSGTFENIINEMDQEGVSPDFISTCVFPYDPVGAEESDHRRVSTDPDHVKNEILSEKYILGKYKNITQNIWVVAMGVSIQTLDFVNDTCFQATYYIKNTIDLIGIVDAVGYYQLSDISVEYAQTSRILYGASGILSRDGLKKPGFEILQILGHISRKIITKEDSVLVSTNGVNTVNVLMCNYSYYNEEYSKSVRGCSQAESAYSVFSNPQTKAIEVVIKGLKPGKYKIAASMVGREHGSLFDEWIRYGILDDLMPVDTEYLNSVVHPQRLAQYAECTDGVLEIRTQLLPHETKHFEINRII